MASIAHEEKFQLHELIGEMLPFSRQPRFRRVLRSCSTFEARRRVSLASPAGQAILLNLALNAIKFTDKGS